MYGDAVMKCGGVGTKFKSPFGEAPNVVKKKYKKKGPSYRKPVSFFDSQKIDKTQLPGNGSTDEETDG